MMKINISQAKQEIGGRIPFHFTIPADALSIDDKHPWENTQLHVDGEVIHTGSAWEAKGVIHASGTYQCTKCLETFTSKDDITFDEEYRERTGTTEPDAEHVYCEGDEIDITDLVRESLLLSEPLNPVCSESCLGLCWECGANRNETQCSCKRESLDPRLAALQQLLK